MLGLIVLCVALAVTAVFAMVGILLNKSADHNENSNGHL
jgi:hypothetical protein